MSVKGVIFDLDGTLANTLPVCIAGHKRSFQKLLGHTYSDAEIRAMFGPSEEGIVQKYVPNRWEAALDDFLQEYEKAHDLCPEPFPGVTAALDLLQKKGALIAVVTGKGPRSAAISLRRLDLERYFDIVETGAPEGVVKPRCMRDVLERWKMGPEEAAYVGDVVSDIRSAREAGVLALSAAWAETSNPEALAAHDPDALFRTVPEFVDWIETHIP